jgi:hypothetical protein
MKLILVAVLGLLFSAVAYADVPVPVDQLPDAIKIFVQQNFPENPIVYAEQDWNSYECRLNNGTKVEFDKNGEWKKVDCEMMTVVPAAIIPDAIKQYVSSTFADSPIIKIEKERYGYKVELANDLELMFNKQGAFMGMDD